VILAGERARRVGVRSLFFFIREGRMKLKAKPEKCHVAIKK
jgi:hypothetical protein